MLGLRQQSEARILNATLARTAEILALIESWGPPRQSAARRLVGDLLSRRLLDVEGGGKLLAQSIAELRARLDQHIPAPAGDTGAALADELVLNFLIAMKFCKEPRLRHTCEAVFQAVHRFASG